MIQGDNSRIIKEIDYLKREIWVMKMYMGEEGNCLAWVQMECKYEVLEEAVHSAEEKLSIYKQMYEEANELFYLYKNNGLSEED